MYLDSCVSTTTPPPTPSVRSITRPRSVLLSSSYARPYISPTTNITTSSILSKDYRSKSQPPTKRIPLLPRHTHTNNVITRDSIETPTNIQGQIQPSHKDLSQTKEGTHFDLYHHSTIVALPKIYILAFTNYVKGCHICLTNIMLNIYRYL